MNNIFNIFREIEKNTHFFYHCQVETKVGMQISS